MPGVMKEFNPGANIFILPRAGFLKNAVFPEVYVTVRCMPPGIA